MSISTLIGAGHTASLAAATSQATSSSATSATGAGTAASSKISVETTAVSSAMITLSAPASGSQVSLSAAGVALPAQGQGWQGNFAQGILYGMTSVQQISNQYEGTIIAQQGGNFSPATMAVAGQVFQEYSQSPDAVQASPELTPGEQKSLTDAVMPDVEMALTDVAVGEVMPMGGIYCWLSQDRPVGVFGIDSITTSITSAASSAGQTAQAVTQDVTQTGQDTATDTTSATGAQQTSSANQANLTLGGMCYFYGQEMQFQVQAQLNASGQLTSSFSVTSTTPAPAPPTDTASAPAAASDPAGAASGPADVSDTASAGGAATVAGATQPHADSPATSATSAAASKAAPAAAVSPSALAAQFSSLGLDADLAQSKTVIDLLSSVTGQLSVSIDSPTVDSASFVGILGRLQLQF